MSVLGQRVRDALLHDTGRAGLVLAIGMSNGASHSTHSRPAEPRAERKKRR